MSLVSKRLTRNMIALISKHTAKNLERLIMSPFLEFLRFKNSQKATFANHLALK